MEKKRFGNGDITQHLTSVDIEEIVRIGGFVIEFFEGLICDNLDFNLFEKFILGVTEKRNKFKKEKKTLIQTLAKTCSNGVYGFSIRSDVLDSYNVYQLIG